MMSDNSVAMKTITRRQLSREPSKLDAIKPGETVSVPDSKGGLLVTRPKKARLTPEQMMAQLDALPGLWPAIDSQAVLGDEP